MKLFLLLSFLLTVITSGQGVTYCVKPNATATCRAEDHCQQVECHIVQYYFDNVDKTINQEKDVTMIFLEGTHTVTDTVVLSAPTLSMIGKGQVVRVVYNCCNCSLLFSNTDVSIQNLNIMQLQQLSGIDSTLGNCSCYFAFWNTAAVLENFYAYKASIAINSSSVSIRGKCEFAGSTAIAIASGLSSITVSGNVTFTNNTGIFGAAVLLFLSNLTVAADANIIFLNNSVNSRGGAMYMYSSHLYIESGVNITFINNSAYDKGGAIYIGPDLGDNFITLIARVPKYSQFYLPNCSNISVHLSFDNNSAAAGDDIYGTSLEAWFYIKLQSCYSFTRFSSNISWTSDPLRVCLCDNHGESQCTNTDFSRQLLQVHPGERFTTPPLVIVGYDLHPTIGVVYANLFQISNGIAINTRLDSTSQKTLVINDSHQCTDLSFSLLSNETLQTVTMYITPEHTTGVTFSYINALCSAGFNSLCVHIKPVILEITLLPCPPGFLLRDDHCDCYLDKYKIICSIVNGTGYFSWNTTAWISIRNNTVLYSSSCPQDFCKTTSKNINLQDDSDSQCAFNRTGKLCGGCKDNYSLAIGSSHCIHCPNNNNLVLLIFFAAAGLMLVFFISAFNLTVTQGIINGLIFYANIVWTYQSMFFPQELVSNAVLTFLKTLIAWINLDFGIETCFIKGLNALCKAGLQFIFPFYIWIIAGLIIVAAKYSTRVTNLLGNRGVPVLNTLFLFSYIKLLRIAVSIMQPSILYEYPTNLFEVVWSDDGNLVYCGIPHIFLFLAGLATLLVVLFLALVLFLVQWLRRGSHLLLLKWITRFNPVFDAYFAPLRHKHQYWFGVLLLARIILYMIYTFSYSMPQGINVNLLLLQISMVVSLCYMTLVQPYKNWATSIVVSTYLANLAALSGFFLFTKTQSDHVKPILQVIAITLSSVIAFVPFCCIIVYKIVAFIKKKCKPVRCCDIYNNHEASPSHFSISYHRDPVIHSGEAQPLLDLSDSSNQLTY